MAHLPWVGVYCRGVITVKSDLCWTAATDLRRAPGEPGLSARAKPGGTLSGLAVGSRAPSVAEPHALAREQRAFRRRRQSPRRAGGTLTVLNLDLPPALRRFFATTNCIENLIATVRDIARNVKRWRAGDMIHRWVGLGLLRAATRFRRLKRHRELPHLVRADRQGVGYQGIPQSS